ncbi:PQQ-binding-like beta-propeller repeat protein [Streptomyces sp. NPDC058625]|uniref:PQQ-binding-like beta-propeller repeat protein n=1 Tax=Streptomyces sp. NPDC058625 TaxID=3346564 RepID=UPI0036554767
MRPQTLSASGRRGFTNPAVTDGTLCAGDFDGGVWAVNAKTGKRTWLCEAPGADHAPQTFLKAGATLYSASGPLDGGSSPWTPRRARPAGSTTTTRNTANPGRSNSPATGCRRHTDPRSTPCPPYDTTSDGTDGPRIR